MKLIKFNSKMMLFSRLFLMMQILYRIFNLSRQKTQIWDLKISFIGKSQNFKFRTKRINLRKRSMGKYNFRSILSLNTNTQTQNASKKSFHRISRSNLQMNMMMKIL